jgi:anthranilate synthase component 1
MALLYFFLCDTLVIFDHARQLLRLCVNAPVPEGADPSIAYDRAHSDLQELLELIRQPLTLPPVPAQTVDAASIQVPAGNFTRERFEAAVEKTRGYIHAGDCIQVVASQRFEIPYAHSPIDLYRALRVVNPSPYMFLVDTGDFALVGASPEVHVRLTGERVEIRPIAGTRPRGRDAQEDLALEKDLLADEKERAEHLMLVDLARNDIGRVCRHGSVEVTDYAFIERYSHVMHIVSQVEGRLRDDENAFSLMRATFPAGTLTGAPKVRAMQIISEIEQARRGPYGGALGYFSYDGNLDSCIAIRTALLKENVLYVQSGAGLVADSQPENEFFETVNKARGMLKAVELSKNVALPRPL